MRCPENDPEHVVWFQPRRGWLHDDPFYEPPGLKPRDMPTDATHVRYLDEHDGWVYCRPKEGT